MGNESSIGHGRLDVLINSGVAIHRVRVHEGHSTEGSSPIDASGESTVEGMDQESTIVVPGLSGDLGVRVTEVGWHGQNLGIGEFGKGVRGVPVGLSLGLRPAVVGGDG